jgi:hypothetical protein
MLLLYLEHGKTQLLLATRTLGLGIAIHAKPYIFSRPRLFHCKTIYGQAGFEMQLLVRFLVIVIMQVIWNCLHLPLQI